MKKTLLFILTLILNITVISCEPEISIDDTTSESTIKECCGNGGEIPPSQP
jgi:hypothetical protein